jgi:hypothetical protein
MVAFSPNPIHGHPTKTMPVARTCRTGCGSERSHRLTEGTMGIVIFLLIAFVLLGADRLAEYMRTHPARGVTPRS